MFAVIPTVFSFIYYILTTGLRGYLFRILIALGITYTTYTQVTDVTTLLKSKYDAAFNGLGVDAIHILTLVGLPEAVTIIFSCVTTRLLTSAAGSFAMKS